MAILDVPWTSATTDASTSTIKTSFSNIPFAVYDSAQPIFNAFTTALTLSTQDNPFYLSGNANAKATTAVGEILLYGLVFDVPTVLPGFKDFGGSVTLSDVKVIGGTPDYVILSMVTHMTNPSTITISVGDVTFGVYVPVGATNVPAGPAYIKGLTLVPGANAVAAEFHLTPKLAGAAGATIAKALLDGYMAGVTADLLIMGNQQSTSVASLQQAFSGISLKTSVTGIQNANLIQGQVFAPAVTSFIDGTGGHVKVTLKNPLDTAFSILDLTAYVLYGQNVSVGTLSTHFTSPFTVGAGQTATTEYLAFNLDPTFLPYLPALIPYLTKAVPMDIVQTAHIKLGDFEGLLSYSQKNIMTSFDLTQLFTAGITDLSQLFSKNSSSSALPSSSIASLSASVSSVL
ncbi:hypothetical protein BC938DRAFT_481563, partial [Jimgerdemannia flammicorona]